jgi:prefoldin subunit 5
MNHVIKELQRTQAYHLRQLEENINKIKFHEEAIEALKAGIEQHRETLQQIREALEILEKGIGGETENPQENVCTGSIPQKGVI